MTASQDGREKTREELRKSIEGLEGIYPIDRYEGEVKIGRLRRRGARVADPTRSLTLVEDENGVLLWEDGAVMARPVTGLRRGYRAAGAGAAGVVEQIVVEPLEPSAVGKTLTGFDQRLTPNQGLRSIVKGNLLQPDEGLKPVENGRILLFIHGTFSESQAILNQLSGAGHDTGQALLGRATKHYDQILAFDHPTLSVSPMLNALDLARRLDGTKADIDIICHSRGGLVTRWLLEAFDRPLGQRRAVLVGAPLEGTSLAGPPNIRRVLGWFSNLNRVLGAATSMIPFLSVVSCLARLTATVTSVMASPLVDAAMAMVPGLSAMSRTSNSFELARLNMTRDKRPEYFAVKSNFKPDDPGWKFWEYFVDQPLLRAAHAIFPGENDLVVDTASMTVLESTAGDGGARRVGDIPPDRVHDFGQRRDVYHTNYFAQAATCQKIAEWLQIP